MPSYPSRSKEWERVRTVEDALALVTDLLDRRRVIRALAHHETNWDQVYFEATEMGPALLKLKGLLSERWGELYAEVTGDGDEETR